MSNYQHSWFMIHCLQIAYFHVKYKNTGMHLCKFRTVRKLCNLDKVFILYGYLTGYITTQDLSNCESTHCLKRYMQTVGA
jgi:hypothetical protein